MKPGPPGAQESRTSAAHEKATSQRAHEKAGTQQYTSQMPAYARHPHHEPPELPQVTGTTERQWCGGRPKARDARHATAQLALALGVQHPRPGRPFLLPRARDRHAQRLAR